MECPNCICEMEAADETLWHCSACGRLGADASDLNRLLLHHNLPGLESLGGRIDPEALIGQCSACQVDLLSVEGSAHMAYEMCESCSSAWVPLKKGLPATALSESLIAFFVTFGMRTSHSRRRTPVHIAHL